jgi:uncharacterized protein (TIGR01244 family)
MTEFRAVTEDFAVSPQIGPADIGAAAAQGFTLIINNRPDGEAADQPASSTIAAAAAAAGIDYVHIPIVGRPTEGQAGAVGAAASKARGRTLAFCRSGARSITAWAMGQAASGASSRDELIRLGREAGYDLSGALG